MELKSKRYNFLVIILTFILTGFASANPVQLSGVNPEYANQIFPSNNILNSSLLDPIWVNVGQSPIAPAVLDVDFTVDKSGTPYLSYEDANRGYNAFVMKYNSIQESWVFLGKPGLSNFDGKNTQLAVSKSGVVYIAYVENNSSILKVMKYESSSNTWASVGNTNITGPSDLSFAIDYNGTPYLAYQNSNGSGLSVISYNETKNSWIAIGAGSITDGEITLYPSLAIDGNGILYIGYEGFRTTTPSATVMKYVKESDLWVPVGKKEFAPNASAVNLAVSESGTLYIAYQSSSASGSYIYFMKYSNESTSWQTMNYLMYSRSPKLAIDNNGVPYVAYIWTNGPPRDFLEHGVVAKFDGSNWVLVGGTYFAEYAGAQKIALDESGIPYVAYQDYTQQQSNIDPVVVKKLSNSNSHK